jgi:hypothetical protein
LKCSENAYGMELQSTQTITIYRKSKGRNIVLTEFDHPNISKIYTIHKINNHTKILHKNPPLTVSIFHLVFNGVTYIAYL